MDMTLQYAVVYTMIGFWLDFVWIWPELVGLLRVLVLGSDVLFSVSLKLQLNNKVDFVFILRFVLLSAPRFQDFIAAFKSLKMSHPCTTLIQSYVTFNNVDVILSLQDINSMHRACAWK